VGVAPPKGVVTETVRKGIEPKSQVHIALNGSLAVDSSGQVALDAMSLVLENRLRLTLREALRGTYGVEVQAGATKVPSPRYNVAINFGCDPERTEELVKTVFQEIDLLKESGPTEGELNDAREALLRRHESHLARNGDLVSEISARLEDSEDLAGFFGLPQEYQKLTTGRLQEAARRYLDATNYVRVTLVPEKAMAGR
jgi:zinc protease